MRGPSHKGKKQPNRVILSSKTNCGVQTLCRIVPLDRRMGRIVRQSSHRSNLTRSELAAATALDCHNSSRVVENNPPLPNSREGTTSTGVSCVMELDPQPDET